MTKPPINQTSAPGKSIRKFFPLLIFVAAFLQYANTLSNDFAWDDAIVIRDNMHTRQGIAGLKTIWTKPVYIPQRNIYRPIPQTTFALEQHFFGNNPAIGHGINAFFYGVCCLLLFITLRQLLAGYHIGFPLLATLLFIVHPVHTEVVANIKSRDEILALSFSLASLFFFLKYFENKKISQLITTVILLLFAVLSKLNAITMLAVFPLVLIFRKHSIQHQQPSPGKYQLSLFAKDNFAIPFSKLPATWHHLAAVLFFVFSAVAVLLNIKLLAFLSIGLWAFTVFHTHRNYNVANWSIAAFLFSIPCIFFRLEYTVYMGMLLCLTPLLFDKKWQLVKFIPYGIVSGVLIFTMKSSGIYALFFFMLAIAYSLRMMKHYLLGGLLVVFSMIPVLFFDDLKMSGFVMLLTGIVFLYKKLNASLLLKILLPLLCIIAFFEIYTSNNNNFLEKINAGLFPKNQTEIQKQEATVDAENETLELSAINNSIVKINHPDEQYATIATIQLRYLGKLIFPYALVHTYGINSVPKMSWKNALPWLSVLVHLLLFVFALFGIFRGDPVAFGILFYFITISIYSHLVQLAPDTMAERFLFFPSVGFCIAMVFLLAGLFRADMAKRPFATLPNTLFFCFFFLLFTAFAIRTFIRNMDWKDNLTLATNTLKFAPDNALIHANYASEWMHLFEQNPNDPKLADVPQKATAAYEKAIAIHPKYFNAIIDLGTVYTKWGKADMARQTFGKGIQANPKNPLSWYHLGIVAYSTGDYETGIQHLEDALQKYKSLHKDNLAEDPTFRQVFMFLARCYFNTGSISKAEATLNLAIKEIPGQTMFHVLAAKMLAGQNQFNRAISYLEKAQSIQPQDNSISELLIEYRNLSENAK